MAIRDVGGKPTQGGAPANPGALPPAVEKNLNEAGLVPQGKSPGDAAKALLGNLQQRGFQAPPGVAKNDVAMQLILALKQFQSAQGLPVNGQLNAQTVQALKTSGVVPDPNAQQADKKTAEKDGFERGASVLKQGERQRADAVNAGTPDTNFLDALLNQLGPGGPNEGMSANDVKGAAQASEAQAQQVDKSKVAEAKKGEGALKKGSTAEAQKDPKDLQLPTNQQMDKGNAQGVKVMRGLRADETKTEEKRRRDAIDGKNPTELGILDEEADEDAVEGAGDDGNKRRGRGGDQEGGGEEEASDTGAEAGGPEDGSERDRGNASSGDEDHDAPRGHASLDDGGDDGPGHYRVPSMAEQARAALAKIQRDVSVENRATTYSWDVVFFKPGVYGAGQKAQELVHLVVDKATAFDPVWQKAQANLVALVKRTDPQGQAPSLDDIINAIRQARARDGDESAFSLRKVTKPIGRA